MLQPIERGGTKAAAVVAGGLRADLRLVESDEMPSALLHFTGSKEHNVELRSRAKGLGWTLNEYGLHDGEDRFPLDSERAIYGKLGLAWIPPEAREGLGEVELAALASPEPGPALDLVEYGDLRGTLHVHTDWSDGIATLAAMATAAGKLGWEYLGIADHSRAAAYARGLDAARVRKQWEEIDRWNAEGRKPWLFKGTECDILADGALDFDDELLLGFDYVVASVHSRFSLSREAMTARWVRAASHPCVTFLGHLSGRLLLVREPYDLDLDGGARRGARQRRHPGAQCQSASAGSRLAPAAGLAGRGRHDLDPPRRPLAARTVRCRVRRSASRARRWRFPARC